MAASVRGHSTEPKPPLDSLLLESRRQGETHEHIIVEPSSDEVAKRKRPTAFYLAFLSLNINAFVFALDATSMPIAIPVGFTSLCLFSSLICLPD